MQRGGGGGGGVKLQPYIIIIKFTSNYTSLWQKKVGIQSRTPYPQIWLKLSFSQPYHWQME